MSQNIAKFMAYVINVSGGDFQQDEYLYKQINGNQWVPSTCELKASETSLRESRPVNFWQW